MLLEHRSGHPQPAFEEIVKPRKDSLKEDEGAPHKHKWKGQHDLLFCPQEPRGNWTYVFG